jgi:hypothetical protein
MIYGAFTLLPSITTYDPEINFPFTPYFPAMPLIPHFSHFFSQLVGTELNTA